MKRRNFLGSLFALSLPIPAWAHSIWTRRKSRDDEENQKSTVRIAFGSCCWQDQPQKIWNSIVQTIPDLFIFLGDNVYSNSFATEDIRHAYGQLEANPDFFQFRRQVPQLIGVWDDHDYGMNDTGCENPNKEGAKEAFMEFFRLSPQSPIRQRDGVYSCHWIEKQGLKIQILLLDLRWFRTALAVDENGFYYPNPDPEAKMLGEDQWSWLESQLRQPADLRILGSSIQFISSDHPWEKWANFPFEKRRFLKLLDDMKIRNLLILSGDMHFAEISWDRTPQGIDLFDFTSSGLNRYESASEIVNSHRLSVADTGFNFGLISIEEISQSSARIELSALGEREKLLELSLMLNRQAGCVIEKRESK